MKNLFWKKNLAVNPLFSRSAVRGGYLFKMCTECSPCIVKPT